MADTILSPIEARMAVERKTEELIGHSFGYLFTPPFPREWPPEGKAVVYYAYVVIPRATSTTQYTVRSPELKIRVALEKKAPPELEIQKLTPEDLPHPQLDSIEKVSQETLDQGAAVLFQWAKDPATEPEESPVLRKTYREWLEQNNIIGAWLKEQAPAFFAWLDETGNKEI